jgi:hypothetical protein
MLVLQDGFSFLGLLDFYFFYTTTLLYYTRVSKNDQNCFIFIYIFHIRFVIAFKVCGILQNEVIKKKMKKHNRQS